MSTQIYNISKQNKTNRRNSNYYSFISSISNIPNDSIQAIVDRINPQRPRLEITIPPESLLACVNNKLQTHTEILMKQVKFPSDNIQNLIEDSQDGRAIAITDASVSLYTSVGASSYVIPTLNLQTSCSRAHEVPLDSAPMDSYRAEI